MYVCAELVHLWWYLKELYRDGKFRKGQVKAKVDRLKWTFQELFSIVGRGPEHR